MLINKLIRLALTIKLVLMLVSPALAEGKADNYPWEKYSVHAGGFLAALDTNVSLGTSGVGIGIDLEEVTGLDATSGGFRLGALGRFGNSRRHAVNLSYFFFDRTSSRVLMTNISGLGDINDTVQSTFNMQMYKLSYNYSFFMDDRVNFSAGLGLYIMPLEYSLDNLTQGTRLETADVTAPLPTLNLSFEFAFTPKLIMRQSLELFYLEYGGFTGGLIDAYIGLDYRISKHFGLGLGLDSFELNLEANGKDYPEIDFNGDISFKYTGMLLYGKFYF